MVAGHREKQPAGRDDPGDGRRRGFRAWYQQNRRDIRFLVVFGLILLGFYVVTQLPPVKRDFFPAYLRANASVCGVLLRTFGQEVNVQEQAMISPDGKSIQVERGCDAVEPAALFVAAVLASPVSWLSRLLAAVVGTAVLMLTNLVRVATLFLVRVHWPAAFDTMHLDVWQALFILLAIVLWGAWAARAAKRERETAANVSA